MTTRCIIRSLVVMKQRPPHTPPRNYGKLQVLLDRISTTSSTTDSATASTSSMPKPIKATLIIDDDIEIIEARNRRVLKKNKSSDSDCWVMRENKEFDFTSLMDVLDDEADSPAKHVDIVDDALAENIFDADSPAKLVDIVDDALAEKIEFGDQLAELLDESSVVSLPSAPGFTCPRWVGAAEKVEEAGPSLAVQQPVTSIYPDMTSSGGMSLADIYNMEKSDHAVVAPVPSEYAHQNKLRKQMKGKGKGKGKKKKRRNPKAKAYPTPKPKANPKHWPPHKRLWHVGWLA